MIDLAALQAIRTVFAHRRPDALCPDAVAAAVIVRDVLPSVVVHFVEYGEELANVAPRPGLLFLDICPTPATAESHVAAGAIVLDHHRTARSIVEMFGARGVYADEYLEPGVSGAMLAFREVWKPLAFRKGQRPPNHTHEGRGEAAVHRFALLAGIADTYQRGSSLWEEASAQAAALAFWSWKDFPYTAFDAGGTAEELRRMLAIGPALRRRRAEDTGRLIALGYRVMTSAGTRVLIVPSRETTDVADMVGDEIDLVVGFGFSKGRSGHPILTVSTRSPVAFDCSAFCAANGGGGHRRASGFELELWASTPHPYAFLLERVEAWETEHRRAIRSEA